MTDSKPTVWEIVRRHARVQNVDAFAVLAAVEAVLEVLQQREGSTPIASPAPCGAYYSWQSHGTVLAGSIGPCVADGAHEQHRDKYGNEWPAGIGDALLTHIAATHDGEAAPPAPAGEVVSVPPPAQPLATGGIITDPPILLVDEGGCALTQPPPLGALLELIDKFGDARYDVGLLVGGPSEAADEAEAVAVRLAAAINAAVNALHAAEPAPVPPPVDALLVLLDKWLEEDVDDHTANGWAAIREDIETRARALWAAGVAEGRRLLDETAATAAVHAYELGIAEGRRQATEERTEEQQGDDRG